MLRRGDPLQIYADVGGKKLVDAIKSAEAIKQQYDRRYWTRRRVSTLWHEVGAVRQVRRSERSFELVCENGWVELFWAAPDCLRVRLRTLDGNFSEPESAAVLDADLAAVTLDISESENVLEVRSSKMACIVDKNLFQLRLETLPDRQLVCGDSVGMRWGDLGNLRLTLALAMDESCYGLGMRAGRFNLRGSHLQLWNADPGSVKRDSDPLSYSVPFYLGIRTELAYGVFWDNPGRGTVELGINAANELMFEVESGEFCYYLIAGGDANAVLSRYSALVGRVDMPPLWALDYGQGQFSYASAEEATQVAANFRERAMPGGTLYLDLAQSQGDRSQLKQIVAELHALGFRAMARITPGITREEAAQLDPDLLVRYPDGEPVSAVTWPGSSCFLDFSAPATWDYWAERIAPLIACGIDGFALELPEPTVFSASGKLETLPDYAEQRHGKHEALHNLYAAQFAGATKAACKTSRPVLVTRSGYAGSPGLVVTGANAATWEHLRLSLRMILNLSLSGLPLSGVNVGGYQGECDGELFTRWLQAACLLPLLRADSFAGTAVRQPWSFGQPYELINRLMLELRNRLLPYLYAQIARCHEYGSPVVRPLLLLEPGNLALREVDDAYLVGDVLVAPVMERGASGRTLYLPHGVWYDYWTNEAIVGGRVIEITAALERLPLYIRAGAALPEVLATPETQLLHVYPGDAETVLYEDSGDGSSAEDGNYRWVYMSCAWDERLRFSITRRTAGRYRPAYKAIRVEIVGLADEPLDVSVDRQNAPLWYYNDGVLEVTVDENFQRIEITRRSGPDDRTLTHRSW